MNYIIFDKDPALYHVLLLVLQCLKYSVVKIIYSRGTAEGARGRKTTSATCMTNLSAASLLRTRAERFSRPSRDASMM